MTWIQVVVYLYLCTSAVLIDSIGGLEEHLLGGGYSFCEDKILTLFKTHYNQEVFSKHL